MQIVRMNYLLTLQEIGREKVEEDRYNMKVEQKLEVA